MRVAGLTDKGKLREHNEDRVFPNTEGGVPERVDLLIVADGVGGKLGGEMASKLAVDTVLELLPATLVEQLNPEMIKQAIMQITQGANRRILELTERSPEYHGMATTLTWAVLKSDRAYIGHVGDSRAYLVQPRGVELLTQDHTEATQMVEMELLTQEEAEESRWGDVLTRALGKELTVEVDSITVDLQKRDFLLLCSDGLTRHVGTEEIRDVVLGAQRPTLICQTLIDKANERGGTDNISVIVAKVP